MCLVCCKVTDVWQVWRQIVRFWWWRCSDVFTDVITRQRRVLHRCSKSSQLPRSISNPLKITTYLAYQSEKLQQLLAWCKAQWRSYAQARQEKKRGQFFRAPDVSGPAIVRKTCLLYVWHQNWTLELSLRHSSVRLILRRFFNKSGYFLKESMYKFSIIACSPDITPRPV